MKPANAPARRSTSDPLSIHRHIRSPDELTLSLRPSQSRMAWGPIDSACVSDVKRSGEVAPCPPRAASPWRVRMRWLQPSASNSDANIPVKVTLSNYGSHLETPFGGVAH